jgi:cell division protein FtsB
MGDVERIIVEIVVLFLLTASGLRKGRGIVILSREALDELGRRIEVIAAGQEKQNQKIADLRETVNALPCTKEEANRGS